jgi:hypothetical protein
LARLVPLKQVEVLARLLPFNEFFTALSFQIYIEAYEVILGVELKSSTDGKTLYLHVYGQ